MDPIPRKNMNMPLTERTRFFSGENNFIFGKNNRFALICTHNNNHNLFLYIKQNIICSLQF